MISKNECKQFESNSTHKSVRPSTHFLEYRLDCIVITYNSGYNNKILLSFMIGIYIVFIYSSLEYNNCISVYVCKGLCGFISITKDSIRFRTEVIKLYPLEVYWLRLNKVERRVLQNGRNLTSLSFNRVDCDFWPYSLILIIIM